MRNIWHQREQQVKEFKEARREDESRLQLRRSSTVLQKEMRTQEDDILHERKNNLLSHLPCVEEMNLVVTHTLSLTLD